MKYNYIMCKKTDELFSSKNLFQSTNWQSSCVDQDKDE